MAPTTETFTFSNAPQARAFLAAWRFVRLPVALSRWSATGYGDDGKRVTYFAAIAARDNRGNPVAFTVTTYTS